MIDRTVEEDLDAFLVLELVTGKISRWSAETSELEDIDEPLWSARVECSAGDEGGVSVSLSSSGKSCFRKSMSSLS